MTWLRRNRWGLALLPVAVLLAVVASSSRVVHFWYPYGPHDVQSGSVGEQVHLRQDWQDRSGTYVREDDVTVTSVEPTEVIRDWDGEDVPGKGPEGTRLWRVALDMKAPTDAVIFGCQLEIVDTEGREFPYSTSWIEPGSRKVSPCLNPDEIGPQPALVDGEAHETETERPASWSTVADVLLAEDTVPQTVRIWWEHPTVIEVELPQG